MNFKVITWKRVHLWELELVYIGLGVVYLKMLALAQTNCVQWKGDS